MHGYRPGSMIEAPTVVWIYWSGLSECRRKVGKFRATGCWISDLAELSRKTPKVMNRARFFHGRDFGSIDKPMSRDAENRFGFGNRTSDLSKASYKLVFLNGVHWAAMTHEDPRHGFGERERVGQRLQRRQVRRCDGCCSHL